METQTNTILVIVDTTYQTLAALNQSYILARKTKSKIVLLGVSEGRTNVLSRLVEMTSEARANSEVVVEAIMRNGTLTNEIIKVANILKPLFILMGIIPKDLKAGITSKNTFKIIRESKYPVIAVKGKPIRNSCKTIVLPLDLNSETREKVSKGVELARFFEAQIHVVSVLTHPDEIDQSKLAAYSHQATDYIASKGVHVSLTTIIAEDVALSILNYAHDVDADLIIVMSKYELNLIDYFIGTTAERLISESDIPVLSLQPKVKKDMTVFVPY